MSPRSLKTGLLHQAIDDQQRPGPPNLKHAIPFPIKKGFLRLIEPADASLRDLTRQILTGEYAKPFVIDDGRRRSLHFNLAHVQSAMRIDAPVALELAYTRKMMAFLMFQEDPARILLIGLGGGSLAKYCYRHLPRSRITAVEINSDVIAFRDLFKIPHDEQRLRVVHADAVDYVSASAESTDTILLDGYDQRGITPLFRVQDFYLDLRRRLSPEGILVANLSGETGDHLSHLALMREVFEDRVLVLDVPRVKNKVAFAFNSDGFHRHFKTQPNDRLN